MNDAEKVDAVQELSAAVVKLAMASPMPWFATVFAIGVAAKALTIDATNNGWDGHDEGETNLETAEKYLTGGFGQPVQVVSLSRHEKH